MSTEIVIPQCGFSESKTRLSSMLRTDQRAVLAEELLVRTMSTALAITAVSVVSPSEELAPLVQSHGARFLRQSGRGLNGALDDARRDALSRGIEILAVLHADLPLLHVDDVMVLLSGSGQPSGLTIAPDRWGVGTNALVLRPPGAFRFHFGPRSFAAHAREARDSGLPMSVNRRRGLSFDLDTPKDIATIFEEGSPQWLRNLIGDLCSTAIVAGVLGVR